MLSNPRPVNHLILSACGLGAFLPSYIDLEQRRNHIVLQLSIMFELTSLPKHVGVGAAM